MLKLCFAPVIGGEPAKVGGGGESRTHAGYSPLTV